MESAPSILSESNLDIHNAFDPQAIPPFPMIHREQEEEEEEDNTEYTYETDLIESSSAQIQKEWEENVIMLKSLVNFVILPLIGKVLGRRTAHFIWRRVAELVF